MRRFVVGLAILTVLTFSTTFVRADDDQIAQHLVQKLQEQKKSGDLKGFGIDLKVESGTIWLKGRVSSLEQHRLVLEIARHTPGVKQVINDLNITPSTSTPPASLASVPVAKPLPVKSKSTLEEFGSAVKRAFAPRSTTVKPTAETKAADEITPETKVALAGITRSSRRKTRSVLRPIKPTTETIVPQRTLVPQKIVSQKETTAPQKETTSDQSSQIAQKILQELRQHKSSGALKHFGLDMKVDKNVVKMTGHVASLDQQQLVLETVRRVAGVKFVVNDIQIQSFAPAAIDLPTSPINTVALGTGVAPVQTVAQASAPKQQPVTAPALENSSPILAPAQIAPAPVQYTEAPVAQVAQAPAQVIPAPAQYTQAPTQVIPAPAQYTQAPAQVIPAPAQYTQAPAQVIPAPAQYTQAPAQLAPAPVARPQYATPYQPRVAQTPLAFAPSGAGRLRRPTGAAQYRGPVSQGGPAAGQMPQMPPYVPAGNASAARYDHPQMPGYAWPSYTPHPNYAGVTYPKQYSPSAWPYIGPFYPYPQVPLGWRKVSLEWKDGWWMLDFKDRN